MIFRSRYPDLDIPDISLPAFVLAGAAGLGSKPALIDGPTGRALTYAELAGSVRQVAASLARRGFEKGDVFAIYSPNVLEYAVALHAVATLGGIATTSNPLSTPREVALQLNDSRAKYLVTIPELLDHALEATRQAPVKEVFVFGEAARATPFAALMEGDDAVPAVSIDPRKDLVALPYSSGTTGLPKGVMLTHRNLVANIVQTSAVVQAIENERSIAVLPFYHIYGFTVLLNISLYQGVTIVTMPRFDLELFLRLMQDYAITRANVVPPIVLALAKHPLVARYDLHALLSINSGAAPLDANVEQACGDRLKCFVAQGYGLTETSPVVSTTPVDPLKRRGGSAGLLIPNTECKVMDPLSGAELGPGGQGEVWIRGPQVMTGYLNNPDATAAMLDAQGWLHTGDIGSVDADGYLHVVDRLKELIKYKGYQVAPAELEGLLLTHPAVADAAVIPCPDPEAGEVPKALVVLKGAITPDELMAFVNQQVAPYKKIRQLDVVDQIPKSPSGKILRRVLVEQERTRIPS
ncbi:MAG: AMP-binding protein [Candidatus Dormibacteraeota bacterium]|nr:AMP-binding protein [Candidatus Dormibacteraeota bacterium]